MTYELGPLPSPGARSDGPYVVLVEHDWQMWEFVFHHNWRWVCRLVVWWNTRPEKKWCSRNVEIHP